MANRQLQDQTASPWLLISTPAVDVSQKLPWNSSLLLKTRHFLHRSWCLFGYINRQRRSCAGDSKPSKLIAPLPPKASSRVKPSHYRRARKKAPRIFRSSDESCARLGARKLRPFNSSVIIRILKPCDKSGHLSREAPNTTLKRHSFYKNWHQFVLSLAGKFRCPAGFIVAPYIFNIATWQREARRKYSTMPISCKFWHQKSVGEQRWNRIGAIIKLTPNSAKAVDIERPLWAPTFSSCSGASEVLFCRALSLFEDACACDSFGLPSRSLASSCSYGKWCAGVSPSIRACDSQVASNDTLCMSRFLRASTSTQLWSVIRSIRW